LLQLTSNLNDELSQKGLVGIKQYEGVDDDDCTVDLSDY
jgi:hypothetical protein